jgi:hypothetical protein
MPLTCCSWHRTIGQVAADRPQRNVYGKRRSRLKLLPLSAPRERPGHTKTNVQALSPALSLNTSLRGLLTDKRRIRDRGLLFSASLRKSVIRLRAGYFACRRPQARIRPLLTACVSADERLRVRAP